MTFDLNPIKERLRVMREVEKELYERGGKLPGNELLDDISALIEELEKVQKDRDHWRERAWFEGA